MKKIDLRPLYYWVALTAAFTFIPLVLLYCGAFGEIDTRKTNLEHFELFIEVLKISMIFALPSAWIIGGMKPSLNTVWHKIIRRPSWGVAKRLSKKLQISDS